MSSDWPRLRWRLAAIMGPELVALAIIVLLVIVVGVSLVYGAASDHLPSRTPGAGQSPQTSGLWVAGESRRGRMSDTVAVDA